MKKVCPKCEEIKELSEFYVDKRTSSNHTCYCKECLKIYGKKRRLYLVDKFSGLYAVWTHMKSRCNCKGILSFERYGGRGIFVCEEWSKSFKSFYDWALNNGFKKGLTIDRTNNNDGYYPENCRFVSQAENNRNRNNCKLNKKKVKAIKDIITYTEKNNVEIAKMFNVSYQHISNIRCGRTWQEV